MSKPAFEVYVGEIVDTNTIGTGTFSVSVVRDIEGKRALVSNISNIPTAALANYRALQCVDSFGATLPWGLVSA